MNATDERVVIDAIEQSAVAGAIERAGARLWRAAQHSTLLASATALCRAAARHAGVTVLAAVLTHLLLMLGFARPASWYWLIVPAICAAAAVVLIAVGSPRGLRRD